MTWILFLLTSWAFRDSLLQTVQDWSWKGYHLLGYWGAEVRSFYRSRCWSHHQNKIHQVKVLIIPPLIDHAALPWLFKNFPCHLQVFSCFFDYQLIISFSLSSKFEQLIYFLLWMWLLQHYSISLIFVASHLSFI